MVFLKKQTNKKPTPDIKNKGSNTFATPDIEQLTIFDHFPQ